MLETNLHTALVWGQRQDALEPDCCNLEVEPAAEVAATFVEFVVAKPEVDKLALSYNRSYCCNLRLEFLLNFVQDIADILILFLLERTSILPWTNRGFWFFVQASFSNCFF